MTDPEAMQAHALDKIVDHAAHVSADELRAAIAHAAAFAHDTARSRYGMGQAPAFVAFLAGHLEALDKRPRLRRRAKGGEP